jgi:hypothetical protein
MLNLSDPEENKNWEAFQKSVSRSVKRDPELDKRIIELARSGVPHKQIKKEVPCGRGYTDVVLLRARRLGIL